MGGTTETYPLETAAVFDMSDAEGWPDALGIAFSDHHLP
jgi:hypothetical protein